ncbi:MAG TPA: hypothetical protein VIJ76_04695 [Galbitalea sp.]
MRYNREEFNWRATRLVFSGGVIGIVMGVFQLVATHDGAFIWGIVIGLILLGISTRGRWDSESSGRNRSVLGFHAHPSPPDDKA